MKQFDQSQFYQNEQEVEEEIKQSIPILNLSNSRVASQTTDETSIGNADEKRFAAGNSSQFMSSRPSCNETPKAQIQRNNQLQSKQSTTFNDALRPQHGDNSLNRPDQMSSAQLKKQSQQQPTTRASFTIKKQRSFNQDFQSAPMNPSTSKNPKKRFSAVLPESEQANEASQTTIVTAVDDIGIGRKFNKQSQQLIQPSNQVANSSLNRPKSSVWNQQSSNLTGFGVLPNQAQTVSTAGVAQVVPGFTRKREKTPSIILHNHQEDSDTNPSEGRVRSCAPREKQLQQQQQNHQQEEMPMQHSRRISQIQNQGQFLNLAAAAALARANPTESKPIFTPKAQKDEVFKNHFSSVPISAQKENKDSTLIPSSIQLSRKQQQSQQLQNPLRNILSVNNEQEGSGGKVQKSVAMGATANPVLPVQISQVFARNRIPLRSQQDSHLKKVTDNMNRYVDEQQKVNLSVGRGFVPKFSDLSMLFGRENEKNSPIVATAAAVTKRKSPDYFDEDDSKDFEGQLKEVRVDDVAVTQKPIKGYLQNTKARQNHLLSKKFNF